MPNWTPDQSKAVYTRGKNLLVSAAAGSGKTAVLVERIIQMILSGDCDIDRMLVVTFTNAAAAEMRSRIHAALADKMSESDDPETLNRLERQSILLSGASIMTVHAFCQMLLRRHFSKIDLDPKFRVADEQELNIFKQEIIADVFERRYSLADPDARLRFQRFTDEFGGNERGDSDLHALVLDLYDTAQSHPDPEGWLRSLPSTFNIPIDASIDQIFWYDEAVKQINFELDAALDECIIL
ncbi:MAG: UvrD-helicase domain-containing protein, partial [Selenomonadaceae bacterium]|nr:UvrD-helicase domain-containing protein [Selenomonadaceae bacterium]